MAAVPSNTTGFEAKCYEPRADSFHLFRDAVTGDLPWPGLVFGLTIQSIWYWCTDQVRHEQTGTSVVQNPRVDHLVCCCSAVGDCPALPLCQEPVPRQGRLCLMWLPEASAHVPHGVPRDDQQDPLHWCVGLSGFDSSYGLSCREADLTRFNPDMVACVDPAECEKHCQTAVGCSNIAYPKLVVDLMPNGGCF